MSEPWLLVAIGILLATHLTVLAYAMHRGSHGSHSRGSQETANEGIECPDCGEINDPDYRYCRHCVAELPTGVRIMHGPSDTTGRRTL